MSEYLFSFGTLRQPEVQLAVFGRSLPGSADQLPGYLLATVTITGPRAIRLSGSDQHPTLTATGDPADRVDARSCT